MAAATPTVTATSAVTSASGTPEQITYEYNDPIGMPPFPRVGINEQINAMPVAKIIPCSATWADGLLLFRLETAWPAYQALAKSVNIKVGAGPALKVAFTPDSLPSETFNNDYGATFLAKFADVIGDIAGDIVQMSGRRNASDVVKDINAELASSDSGILKGASDLIGEGIKLTGEARTKMEASKNKTISQIPGIMDSLLAGQRVDFPSVWKNSSYTTQYSLNVKLYNAFPSDKKAHNRNIVAPLGALLCLALPQSSDGPYSYPFFVTVNAPGLFYLPAAGIQSISVTKGGEYASIAYNQRVFCVDVNISFANLFSTMVIYSPDAKNKNAHRPFLGAYLNNLRDEIPPKEPTELTLRATAPAGVASTTASSATTRNVATGAPAQTRVMKMDITENNRAMHLERSNDNASKLLRSIVRKNN